MYVVSHPLIEYAPGLNEPRLSDVLPFPVDSIVPFTSITTLSLALLDAAFTVLLTPDCVLLLMVTVTVGFVVFVTMVFDTDVLPVDDALLADDAFAAEPLPHTTIVTLSNAPTYDM